MRFVHAIGLCGLSRALVLKQPIPEIETKERTDQYEGQTDVPPNAMFDCSNGQEGLVGIENASLNEGNINIHKTLQKIMEDGYGGEPLSAEETTRKLMRHAAQDCREGNPMTDVDKMKSDTPLERKNYNGAGSQTAIAFESANKAFATATETRLDIFNESVTEPHTDLINPPDF